MKAKRKSAPDTSIRQAELILQLYEVRREAVMREARSYIGGAFLPASADELIAIVSAGTRHSGFVLQVYGYWDMVAAFVVHGALDESLIFDTCQEMYFLFEKIQPSLAGFREKMNLPEFLKSMEIVVGGSQERRSRGASKPKKARAQVPVAEDPALAVEVSPG